MNINCKDCNKKLFEYKTSSFGYCLTCLPDHLRCNKINRRSNTRCRNPVLPNTDTCKLHTNKKYENPFGKCKAHRKNGKKCNSKAISDEGYCKHHYNNRDWLPRKARVSQAYKNKRIRDGRSSGEIYIFNLGFDNLYKIGMSVSGYDQRLQALRAGNPKLSVEFVYAGCADAKELEKFIHFKLSRVRVEREIFRLSSKQLNTIQKFLVSKGYEKIAPND